MNPIRVHAHSDGAPFYLNADHIESWVGTYAPTGVKCTSVKMVGGQVLGVTESPDEIADLIRAWYKEDNE